MIYRAMAQKDGSLVYPIELGLFDIFQGTGWENHSRYRRLRSGTFIHVSGKPLNESYLRYLQFGQ